MVYKNANITVTVIRVDSEVPGYLNAYFERPRGFTFEAGDWIEINQFSDQPPGGTVYSLASSPTEPELRITFREDITPFKKVLAGLRPGNTLVIKQYGNDYGFRLNEHKPSVLIAGGVGIAPFRSMLKERADEETVSTVQLIYLNTSDNFLFQDELREWQSQSARLQLDFISTKELKRKDREKLLTSLLPELERQYYVSGPSGMVQSTLAFLGSHGINSKDVRVDDFGDL